MLNTVTLARPYAKAVFYIARTSGLYNDWSYILKFLSFVIQDKLVKELLLNPMLSVEDKAGFILDVGGSVFFERGAQFVKLLARTERLSLAPAIQVLYEIYRAEAEKKLAVEVISAFKLDDTQLIQLKNAISKKFDREIQIKLTIDPGLLGGIVIKAGDEVIDSSLHGQLESLLYDLLPK